MPYEPNSPSTHDLGWAYNIIWIGAAASVPTFANAFLGWNNIVLTILFIFTMGGLIFASFTDQTDEYFRTILDTGKQWAFLALAMYLFVTLVQNVYWMAHSFGMALANPSIGPGGSNSIRLFLDANVLATGLALVFYAGCAFAWLKDRRGS